MFMKRIKLQRMLSIEGSGGNYLSNEIFYRVARMRTVNNRKLQTGHLHLPLIQYYDKITAERGFETARDLDQSIMSKLIEAIKNIIKNM
jgi:pyrrolidone-carboxylate peptidase